MFSARDIFYVFGRADTLAMGVFGEDFGVLRTDSFTRERAYMREKSFPLLII